MRLVESVGICFMILLSIGIFGVIAAYYLNENEAHACEDSIHTLESRPTPDCNDRQMELLERIAKCACK
jgi:hypothetical protein